MHGGSLEAKSCLQGEDVLNEVWISLCKPSSVASAEPSMDDTKSSSSRHFVDPKPHTALCAKVGNDPDSPRLFSPLKHCHEYPSEDGFLCYLLFLHHHNIIIIIYSHLFIIYSSYTGSCPWIPSKNISQFLFSGVFVSQRDSTDA